jgi:hypothetical protein
MLSRGLTSQLRMALGAIDRLEQAARLVGPIDAIEALSLSTFNPALHCGRRDAELLGHLTEGGSASDGLDHGMSALLGRGFLLMADSSAKGF